jgi:hypothetical protein
MVNGCSGSSLFQNPYESAPVSCVRVRQLPEARGGHGLRRVRRPQRHAAAPGALVESSRRSGLSQITSSSWLLNQEPS